MPVFLWHSTAMMLLIGAVFWLAPALFNGTPGSTLWWALRPGWILVFALGTLPFIAPFSRFERWVATAPKQGLPLWRLLVGAAGLCAGLAFLAAGGISGEGWLGLNIVAALLPVVGSEIAGFGPFAVCRAALGSGQSDLG